MRRGGGQQGNVKTAIEIPARRCGAYTTSICVDIPQRSILTPTPSQLAVATENHQLMLLVHKHTRGEHHQLIYWGTTLIQDRNLTPVQQCTTSNTKNEAN